MSREELLNKIQAASAVVGKTWPLYSFVTSNPLSGYESSHFEKATSDAQRLIGANVLPSAGMFRRAWENKQINREVLINLLREKGYEETPEHYLKQMELAPSREADSSSARLNRIMVKWLSAFMDEGLAEWQMPYKEDGFYNAWRILALYDNTMHLKSLSEIALDSCDTLSEVLERYSQDEQSLILEHHLAALPGWTGYIKHREEYGNAWNQQYTISLLDYLAVRLWIANHLNLNVLPQYVEVEKDNSLHQLKYLWLKAWEMSWQGEMKGKLKEYRPIMTQSEDVPDAQFVFCIDTRSELIRRAVESKGNYETFGYAGFFGIAMDYESIESDISRKSCPPIVQSAYKVTEIPQSAKDEQLSKFNQKTERASFYKYVLKRMKNMLPSSFGFVEGAGFFYGVSLLARTLMPKWLYQSKRSIEHNHEHFCQPEIESATSLEALIVPLEEKTAIVKSAFDLLGWRVFSPLVFFVGHGSHTANNPFGSSLDCGACAASPGRHNARMLAKLANLEEVRSALKTEHGIHIPHDTVFVGAEHNTTTDEIVLFDSEVPQTHRERLKVVKKALSSAQVTAANERWNYENDGLSVAKFKANSWSETRPEWGLAKNSGFIIGPRSITKDLNLQGHCFLHSYDWEMDKEGKALEGIMQGPMVVTQWINNHYYFSTVDNEKFGGGSKITHNITGRFGVVQGNGGDLKIGLPLQSVNSTDDQAYHNPLRLTVFIQAPEDRVKKILKRNPHLMSLLDNEWIYLKILDPKENNQAKDYNESLGTTNKRKKESLAYA